MTASIEAMTSAKSRPSACAVCSSVW